MGPLAQSDGHDAPRLIHSASAVINHRQRQKPANLPSIAPRLRQTPQIRRCEARSQTHRRSHDNLPRKGMLNHIIARLGIARVSQTSRSLVLLPQLCCCPSRWRCSHKGRRLATAPTALSEITNPGRFRLEPAFIWGLSVQRLVTQSFTRLPCPYACFILKSRIFLSRATLQ